MALRELLVEFVTKFDTSALKKGESTIDGMIGKLKGFGTALVGAFAVHEIKEFVFGLTEQADTLRDHAIALGTSVEELQAWHYAAGLAGVGAEEFNGALTKFNKNVAAAADSATGPAADAFKTLGVSVKDSAGNLGEPLDLIDGVAAGLQNIQDPARRTAVVMDLFGRSGAKLLPFLSEGPEGIAKLRAEVAELGGGFTNEFADAADEVNDEMARLNLSTLSLKVRLAAFLLPAINAIVGAAIKFANWFRKIVDGTNIVKTAVTALGAAGVVKLSAMLGPLGKLSAAFGKFALKVLLPLLLLEDLETFLDGGDSLIGRVIDKVFGEGSQERVRQWIEDVKGAVLDFWDELARRPEEFLQDFRQFVAFVRKDLEDAFGPAAVAGLNGLLLLFDVITGGWDNAVNRIGALGEALGFTLETVWLKVKFGAIEAAAGVADAFAQAWNGVLLGASNTIVKIGGALADIPGGQDVAKKVIGGGLSLLGGIADTNHVADAQAARRTEASALLTRAEGIKGRLQTVAAPAVSNQAQVNVSVAPSGPLANQLKQVANAAKSGVQAGLAKGTHRAAAGAFKQRGKS